MRQAEFGTRQGLLRRFLPGGRGSPTVRQHLHADILDLRDRAPRQLAMEDLTARVERLELGLELMATTMRRALTRLAEQAVASSDEVERTVAGALEPLSAAVAELSDQVRSIPATLAEAAAHGAAPHEVDPDLPATPFELEPVDEEVDALTMLRRARFGGEEPD